MVSLVLGFSCKEIENISIQDVSAPVEAEFDIDSPDTNAISVTKLIDASTNKDFMDNRSKLDNIEISAIQYQVKFIGFEAADSLISGRFEYRNPATGVFDPLSLVENKKMVFGIAENLSFDVNVANNIAQSVRTNPYRAEIRFRAEMNKKPVRTIVALKIFFKLKVKI